MGQFMYCLGMELIRREHSLPLRRRAAVVSEIICRGASGVGLILVKIFGQLGIGAIELGTRSLVVSWHDHVRNLRGHRIGPLLPQIPVGLVQHTHITTQWSSLAGNFACREGLEIVFVIHHAPRELRGGTVVADRPRAFAGQDAGIPIVRVADIATVPDKGNSVGDGLLQFPHRARGVGVAHVVQDGNGERLAVAGCPSGGEALHI